MPAISSPSKIQRIRDYRAELVVTGGGYADALAASEVWAEESGGSRFTPSTSTKHFWMEAQIRQLQALGCDKVFSEQVSSVADRARLTAALEYVREGDTFVVTKLDRLARSVAHLVEITVELRRKGVALKIVDMGVDTGTPTGRLFLNIVGSIAEFEREIMLERQREGIAAAKAEGKYKGRAPTARAKTAEIHKLALEGLGKAEIARRLGVGERSVYRMLAGRGGLRAEGAPQPLSPIGNPAAGQGVLRASENAREERMTKHLLAGVAAFGLMSGVAFAQAYPPAYPPPSPPGTIVAPAVPVAPVPVPVPGTSTTTTTVSPSPDADHRETTVHKEMDRKGNTVIEKDTHHEGVSGSSETHTKTETDRDGSTTTHSETTTKRE